MLYSLIVESNAHSNWWLYGHMVTTKLHQHKRELALAHLKSRAYVKDKHVITS